MAENLDETEFLGNALIAQDQDLLDAEQVDVPAALRESTETFLGSEICAI